MPKTRFFAWYRVAPLAFVFVFALFRSSTRMLLPPSLSLCIRLTTEAYVKQSSISHNLDPYLVCAVIKSESNSDPEQLSRTQGARGLMQLMPETAQDMIALGLVDGSEYSADNLNDPATNIEFGCAYFSYLLTYFNGSTDSAIAAYNAGMGNVDGWAQQDTSLHNAITFPETQAYLIRVNNAWVRYKTLYPDRFV